MKQSFGGMMGEAERDLESALEQLCQIAAGVGESLQPDARLRLKQWALLVMEWRQRAALTALPTAAAVVRELMMPAAFALQVFKPEAKTRIVDLGCGSGSTGMTLASVAGRGTWYLVDRSQKKVTFCRYGLRHCGVEGVEALTRREWLDRETKANVVLARALPRTAQTAEDVKEAGLAGAMVVRWGSEPVKEKAASVAKCGSANLWVAASALGGFT